MLKRNFFITISVLVIIICAITGCPPDLDQDSGSDVTVGKKTIISGKAIFANPASSGTIAVIIEKTDGLYVELEQPQTRTARNNEQGQSENGNKKRTSAKADGTYTFEDIEDGIYTIYAVSEDKTEQAVLISIPIEVNAGNENSEITIKPMILKPVGSIRGRIVLDGSGTSNLGFTVFIAGTSYTAITNQAGNFEITNVPEGNGYEIAVMRGNYATIWTLASVESGEATDLEKFDVTSVEINGDAMMWKGALNAPPANPQKNWAYFNLINKHTYIYDGTEWKIMAQVIITNVVVYYGNGNTGGTAPVYPGNYVYDINIPVLNKGNLEKDGCRFGGWSLFSDGSGKIYQPGEKFHMLDTQIVFYAVWKQLYKLNYDGNGNTGGTLPVPGEGITGDSVFVAGAGNLVRTGYRFMGWSTNQAASTSQYSPGSFFTIGNADATLYAVWAKLYTVNYDGNGNTGGAVPGTRQGIAGEQLPVAGADNLVRTGFFFFGWNTQPDASGTAYINTGSILTIGSEDVILYAIWSEFNFDGTYSGTSLDIIIPAEINTVRFTNIRPYEFDSKLLNSVIISDGITNIGRAAFLNNRLTSIVIPNSVTRIEVGAFKNNKLASAVISNSITAIEQETFYNNMLTSVVIPDGVRTIGPTAFSNNQLVSVVIPNSVISIGSHAFNNNRLTSIVIPDGVIRIESVAFANNQLVSVIIPDNVVSIEDHAFSSNPLTLITIPENVSIRDNSSMGDYGASFRAFYDSNGMKAGTYTYDTGTSTWALRE